MIIASAAGAGGAIVAAVAVFLLLRGGGVASVSEDAPPPSNQPASAASSTTNSVQAADLAQAKKNLQQFALFAFRYHDTYSHFPPFGIGDGGQMFAGSALGKKAKVPVSFHTSLIPFTDRGANLASRIDLTRPWTDPVNAEALKTTVPGFLIPGYPEEVTSSGYAVTHFVPNKQVIGEAGRGLRISDVTDGTSKTIMGGQIDSAFPAWGDPSNPRDPSQGFRGGADAFGASNGFPMVMFMDGSVRTIDPSISPEAAAALATPGGGERLQGNL